MAIVDLDRDDPRPVWLLDVDGVLNVSRNAWHEAPWTANVTWHGQRWASSEGPAILSFKFHWAPTLLGRIRSAHRTGLVELVWCTTWCAEADSLENVFKLPPLKRAFTVYTKSQADAWNYKRAAADAVRAAGRRLVWTDDEIPTFGPIRDQLDADPDVLAVTTSPRRGLTPDDMDRIETFARAGALESSR